MPKPRDFLPRTLSARICLKTVSAVGALLTVTILAMTFGTRQIIREETGVKAGQELLQEFDPGFGLTITMIILGIVLLSAGAITIARISMKPLRKLTYMTRSIAKGDYSLPCFETTRTDEVGRLQNHYVKMQQTVAWHIEQLKSLSQSEESRQKELADTYAKTKEIQKHRSAFFSSMTHQMADVVGDIQKSVDKLHNCGDNMGEEQMNHLLLGIEKNGERVTEILNDMLKDNR